MQRPRENKKNPQIRNASRKRKRVSSRFHLDLHMTDRIFKLGIDTLCTVVLAIWVQDKAQFTNLHKDTKIIITMHKMNG